MQLESEEKLRIVFMGTPDFAVTILKKMVTENCHIVGVITAPDKPSGRGRKVRSSSVKEYAISQGLHVLQPTNLKDPIFLASLEALEPDLQVVVAFRMLPRAVWELPKKGTFNLHASLLPQYRGAAPINWAIINGESVSGVTTFFIDEKIDTGAILLKKEQNILSTDTAGELHDKLMHLGAEVVMETIEGIKNNTIQPINQKNVKNLKEAPKLYKTNTRIDWNNKAQEIYNFIRGLSPFPSAWGQLNNNGDIVNLKIFEATYNNILHSKKIGSIHSNKKLLRVFVQDGYVDIIRIQLSGKKPLPVKDLLNGYKLSDKAFMI